MEVITKAIPADEAKRNLPMHPLVAARLSRVASRNQMEWKTRSVVSADGFSKLRRSRLK